MKKTVIGLIIILGLFGAFLKYKPKTIYVLSRIQAAISRQGQIAGNSIFMLSVPFHRQEHALSCEVASLKMALAGTGVEVAESDLIASLKFDQTARQNGVWGDPFTGFVGDIDGRMLGNGYGVYWQPIADVGLKYRRTAAFENSSLQELINHVYHERPVVVWGYFGRGNRLTWRTPQGKSINAIHGEHARVVIGFAGAKENPETIILLDPIYGELHWSTQEFLDNWASLNNSGVVVYKNPRWVRRLDDQTVWEISSDGLSRKALAMSWEKFIFYGGSSDAIVTVYEDYLQNISNSGTLNSF